MRAIVGRHPQARWLATAATAATAQSGRHLVFCGTDDVSLASLQALYHARQSLSLSRITVITPDARPSGRGQRTAPLPVAAWWQTMLTGSTAPATALDMVTVPYGMRDLTTWRCPLLEPGSPRFDLLVVVSFGYFVPRPLIQAASLGAVNVHPSLLPRHRGAAPIPYTLLRGDTLAGVSIIELHPERFDAGGILRQVVLPVQRPPPSLDVRFTRLSPLLHEAADGPGRSVGVEMQDVAAATLPPLPDGVAWHDGPPMPWNEPASACRIRLAKIGAAALVDTLSPWMRSGVKPAVVAQSLRESAFPPTKAPKLHRLHSAAWLSDATRHALERVLAAPPVAGDGAAATPTPAQRVALLSVVRQLPGASGVDAASLLRRHAALAGAGDLVAWLAMLPPLPSRPAGAHVAAADDLTPLPLRRTRAKLHELAAIATADDASALAHPGVVPLQERHVAAVRALHLLPPTNEQLGAGSGPRSSLAPGTLLFVADEAGPLMLLVTDWLGDSATSEQAADQAWLSSFLTGETAASDVGGAAARSHADFKRRLGRCIVAIGSLTPEFRGVIEASRFVAGAAGRSRAVASAAWSAAAAAASGEQGRRAAGAAVADLHRTVLVVGRVEGPSEVEGMSLAGLAR